MLRCRALVLPVAACILLVATADASWAGAGEDAEVLMLDDGPSQKWRNGEATTAHQRYTGERDDDPEIQARAAKVEQERKESERGSEKVEQARGAEARKFTKSILDDVETDKIDKDKIWPKVDDEKEEDGNGPMPDGGPAPPPGLIETNVPASVMKGRPVKQGDEDSAERRDAEAKQSADKDKGVDFKNENPDNGGLPASDMNWESERTKEIRKETAEREAPDNEEEQRIKYSETHKGVAAPVPAAAGAESQISPDVSSSPAKANTRDVTGAKATGIQKKINDMFSANKNSLKPDPVKMAKKFQDTVLESKRTIQRVKTLFAVHNMEYDPLPGPAVKKMGDKYAEGSETEQTRKFVTGQDSPGWKPKEVQMLNMNPPKFNFNAWKPEEKEEEEKPEEETPKTEKEEKEEKEKFEVEKSQVKKMDNRKRFKMFKQLASEGKMDDVQKLLSTIPYKDRKKVLKRAGDVGYDTRNGGPAVKTYPKSTAEKKEEKKEVEKKEEEKQDHPVETVAGTPMRPCGAVAGSDEEDCA